MMNMLELAQPQPATPEQLMDCVRTAWAKADRLAPAAPAPSPAATTAPTMYGTLYDGSKATADAKGTGGVKKCVLTLACDYDDTLLRHNDVPATLDDWFEGLAKFCLNPNVLFKDPKKQQECWEQRVQLCGNHCKPRSTTPGSVVTYANSLAALYKESSNANKFIMSNKALFPKYNLLMKNAGNEHALLKSLDDTPEVEILKDDELPTLWSNVNFNNPFEAQRWNILILGYRTGLRGECLQRLQVASFRRSLSSDGTQMLTCVLGSMKNHQASLNKVDVALLKQQILPCADPRFCAIAAYDRQCNLPRPPMDSEFGGQDALFRTCTGPTSPLGPTPTGEASYRGVYTWVRTIIKRDVTFKDLARRVCMTKLANHPDISDEDIAKYIKINKKTVQVYHRLADNKKDLAARVLSDHLPKQEEPKIEVPKPEVPKPEAPKVEVKVERLSPTVDVFDVDAGNERGMEIDVDEWEATNLDHEACPPSQVSQVPVRQQLEEQKRTYRKRVFAAPATPAGSLVSQHVSSIPSPFKHKRAKRTFAKEDPPTTTTSSSSSVAAPSVSSSSTSSSSTSALATSPAAPPPTSMCYKCDNPIPKKTESRALASVSCDICKATYHLRCTGRACMPRHGWACEGCTYDMNV